MRSGCSDALSLSHLPYSSTPQFPSFQHRHQISRISYLDTLTGPLRSNSHWELLFVVIERTLGTFTPACTPRVRPHAAGSVDGGLLCPLHAHPPRPRSCPRRARHAPPPSPARVPRPLSHTDTTSFHARPPMHPPNLRSCVQAALELTPTRTQQLTVASSQITALKRQPSTRCRRSAACNATCALAISPAEPPPCLPTGY